MKVCLIIEGSYPYVMGGVSGWLQQMMLGLPEIEFSIVAIRASRDEDTEFKYHIPDNVTEIRNVYLLDEDYSSNKKVKLSKREYDAFQSLFFGEKVDWSVIFHYFKNEEISINHLLGGEDFLEMAKTYYEEHFDRVIFSEFLWTMRSMYLPLFTILKSDCPEADVYHCLSTGYAGLLGSMQKVLYHKPFLLSEHGIYTREREEEIIKASWVDGVYKDLWIGQFKKVSECCYQNADLVTALYKGAKELQTDLGCQKDKIHIIPNGVDIKSFAHLPAKAPEDPDINIGAVLRIAPIKDVKTMISAFSLAKAKNHRLKLYLMGPLDEDTKYVEECRNLVRDLNVKDVIFTDRVNVKEHIGKMDILALSSLSEGQPLAILEGFAAKKPYIATNVGDCAGLIYGDEDNLGDAGIIVPPMNVTKLAEAMVTLAAEESLRKQFGEVGHQRVLLHHDNKETLHKYQELYHDLASKRERR